MVEHLLVICEGPSRVPGTERERENEARYRDQISCSPGPWSGLPWGSSQDLSPNQQKMTSADISKN